MPAWFSDGEREVLAAACERVLPPDPESGAPGARALGVADYIDTLLGAFTFDPPRIWPGAGEGEWFPLRPLDELAWRTRIEGSLGRSERETNGPVLGLQERYRNGLADLGPDFARCEPEEQDARLDATAAFKALLYEHACEAAYGDPVYGGNRDRSGWIAIGFPGDAQPGGYPDEAVTSGG